MTDEDVLASTMRKASDADNAALLALMEHVPMEGALALSTQRGPDFFSLYRMQRGSADVYLGQRDDVTGMGAFLVRSGFLDGRAQNVGYLGDLRVQGGSPRARLMFPRLFGAVFDENRKERGCDAYLTGVLASNAMAIASLTKRKAKRAAQPWYHPFRSFDMASIQLVLPRRRRRSPGIDVDTARAVDVPELARFLAADHEQRPFGYRFDDGELEHRLARWPGFSLDDTFVARRGGRVVGVCTAWDTAPVKRYRVMRYAGEMRFVRAGVRAASVFTGCAPLPKEGEDFRQLYLTNLSVEGDDTWVLRALLDAVYTHAWKKRVHFFSLPLFGDDDPWAPALRGFLVQRTGFRLFAVTGSDAPRTDWPSGRPGFEMALA